MFNKRATTITSSLKLPIAIVVLVLLTSACTSSLVVESDFPKPIADTLDIQLGIVYTPEFQNFEYREKAKNRTRWIIQMGKAHTELLEKVFNALVQSHEQLASLDEVSNTQANLILLPKILEFQYSSPRETKVSIYEVWIKYHMQVYDTQGNLIADWIMSAYGKTPSAFLKSNEEAMNQAVMVALRDLGASLTTGFHKVPEIRAWLEQNRPSTAFSPSPFTPALTFKDYVKAPQSLKSSPTNLPVIPRSVGV